MTGRCAFFESRMKPLPLPFRLCDSVRHKVLFLMGFSFSCAISSFWLGPFPTLGTVYLLEPRLCSAKRTRLALFNFSLSALFRTTLPRICAGLLHVLPVAELQAMQNFPDFPCFRTLLFLATQRNFLTLSAPLPRHDYTATPFSYTTFS